ncbi:NUDIX hydrolase [Insolitispirillum peregrinum]|uniref:Uncharacterized conserved protein n=1 Tax=Insolitispirillum peregrinum TaxID=80876 RepID=A0A1N7LKA9_9PROT|nr:hypothetical protein [Insolitispirillum peregrinum]SIS74275.1 Uncharacterized conserved protein [Insolitispirillum peregrinum]
MSLSASPSPTSTILSLTAVVVAVTEEVPRILVARRMQHDLATPAQQGVPVMPEHCAKSGNRFSQQQCDRTKSWSSVPTSDLTHAALAGDSPEALPYGPFDPLRHRTLDHGCRQWLEEQTGLSLRFLEQLYTFGSQNRDPRELFGGPRVVSVAYLGLTQEAPVEGSGDATWRDWYGFLPWEDWRNGRPAVMDTVIRPHLRAWVDQAPDVEHRQRRQGRVEAAFGVDPASGLDPVRSLDRYELLYEARLVPEALRDEVEQARAANLLPPAPDPVRMVAASHLGHPLSVDNRRILASALGRLRGKLAYRPVVFDLLPATFTLLQLQRVVEALFGTCLHKQNFRRTITNMDLVEPTGSQETTGRGRPAELYRFRREALLERRTVGIGVPMAQG